VSTPTFNTTKTTLIITVLTFISKMPYSFHKSLHINLFEQNTAKFSCGPLVSKPEKHCKVVTLYGDTIIAQISYKFVAKIELEMVKTQITLLHFSQGRNASLIDLFLGTKRG